MTGEDERIYCVIASWWSRQNARRRRHSRARTHTRYVRRNTNYDPTRTEKHGWATVKTLSLSLSLTHTHTQSQLRRRIHPLIAFYFCHKLHLGDEIQDLCYHFILFSVCFSVFGCSSCVHATHTHTHIVRYLKASHFFSCLSFRP